jgi:hypothetical protein
MYARARALRLAGAYACFNLYCLYNADDRWATKEFYSAGHLKSITNKLHLFDAKSHWCKGIGAAESSIACVQYNFFSDVPIIIVMRGYRKDGGYTHWWNVWKSFLVSDAHDLESGSNNVGNGSTSKEWHSLGSMRLYLDYNADKNHPTFKDQIESEIIPILNNNLALEHGCHGTIVYRRRLTAGDLFFSGVRTVIGKEQ